MALNSTTSIALFDLLCEGPIGGVIGGLDGVYLNETPVTTNGVYNFNKNHVKVDTLIGAKQSATSGTFQAVSTITDVGLEIGENYSETLNAEGEVESQADRDYGPGTLTRQITNTEVSQVQLLFTVPKLFSVAQEGLAEGQLFGGRIDITVKVQDVGSGGSFVQKYGKSIKGISTNNYQFLTDYITLTGDGPWNIKVEKVNLKEDHFEIKYTDFEEISDKKALANGCGNQIIWSSITEYVDQVVNHNYSAIAQLQLSSESFPQLPTRAYLIKGRLVKIPSGAAVKDDGSLILNDADFDNTPQKDEHWTSCPVCTFIDLLTNPRYGAGKFVDESLISWVDLYPLIKYSNQTIDVKDANGKVITTEPRFSCNVVIGDKADAYSVLRDMASVFRGMLFWSSNTIQVAADHGEYDASTDVPIKHVYSNSNVANGIFEYSGSALKTRSTSVRVRYNDPENLYKTNFVVVEDSALIAKYGYQVKEIVGFGCTSKYQATRIGMWVLKSEELGEETCTFNTGLSGAVALPGEVFGVADQLRAAARLSGRVASATTSSVVADQSITLPSGDSPTLTCTLADGTVESKAISSVSGSTINLSASFSSAPLAQSIWSITTASVAMQKFRCIGIADGGDGTFAITGVTHNDSLYAAVDEGKPLDFEDVTVFDDAPPPVTNITLDAGQVTSGTGKSIQATISWAPGA